MAKLARWMIPGIGFICLFGLTSGLLYAEKSFFLPAVSSVAFNTVWILSVIVLSRLPIDKAMMGLSCIISVAFLVQWLMTCPRMWKYLKSHLSLREIFHVTLFSSEIKILLQPILLGILGVAAVQINGVIDALFAKWASPEGPAYLWYAIRLQQLPLGLFSIALSSALLPSLSRCFEKGQTEEFAHLLHFAKKQTFTLIFPCVVGIFVLGASSVNLLFGHGDFTPQATTQTILCLWGYGLGLLPAAFVQILAPSFYAKKDWRTPAQGFILAAFINCMLDAFLVFQCKAGPASIALATSVATLCNFLFLLKRLDVRKEPWLGSWKVAICSLIAGGCVFWLGFCFLGDQTLPISLKSAHFPRELSQQIAQFGIQTALYFLLFFALCRAFRARDVLKVFNP